VLNIAKRACLWRCPETLSFYSALSRNHGNSAVYVSTVANPRARLRLVSTGQNALFANGGDGKTYLDLAFRSGSHRPKRPCAVQQYCATI
jgi:hypothetical protein